jgi:hypothetical protein
MLYPTARGLACAPQPSPTDHSLPAASQLPELLAVIDTTQKLQSSGALARWPGSGLIASLAGGRRRRCYCILS